MKRKTSIVFAWFFCGVAPLFAQKAFERQFDVQKPIHLEGAVIQAEWANPHVALLVAVPGSNRETANWRVELPAPNDLIRAGLNRNAIAAGSVIAVDGFLATTAEQIVGGTSLTLKASGQSIAISEASWHHSLAEEYDRADLIQLTGKVTRVDWSNPTPRVYFAVASQEWFADLRPIAELSRMGWQKTSIASGDIIAVRGFAAKAGSRNIFAQNVSVMESAGKTLAPPVELLK